MSETIELYKLMVTTITAHELRRQQVTTVNTSLLVAGMAALGGIKNLDPIYIALPAIPIALIWLFSIHYYRRLAKVKWYIVHEFEKNFDARPFTDEWEKFKKTKSFVPYGLTQVEMFVPAIVLAVAPIYLFCRALQQFC